MKLNELFVKEPVNEVFGGAGKALARKIGAALNPTEVGVGARDLEKKTNALTQNWMRYRGETKAIPNSANIEHWLKTKAGLDDPEIWSQAINEFSEENPSVGEKYKEVQPLDAAEISNFFNKLIQVRLMHPDTKFYSTAAPAAGTKATDTATPTKPNEWAIWDKSALKNQPASAAETFSGGPAHPVSARSSVRMRASDQEPVDDEQDHPLQPDALHVTPPTSTYSYTRTPASSTSASAEQSKHGNAGNVDWEAIRNRFPQTKTKPRVSVPMGSKPLYRVPAGSKKI